LIQLQLLEILELQSHWLPEVEHPLQRLQRQLAAFPLAALHQLLENLVEKLSAQSRHRLIRIRTYQMHISLPSFGDQTWPVWFSQQLALASALELVPSSLSAESTSSLEWQH
jgi:hypothetical protein